MTAVGGITVSEGMEGSGAVGENRAFHTAVVGAVR